ncbi:hypothetical protein [Bradyrhizobium sp. CCBAU 11357]|uniref:hypothetical protein n=1 Tax=Bradyrhizobium sp. CCBAU 11357 TaxID=1630808 RepID=UPI002304489C|nr:hypothetical protein [Bradyrhizobium sp. CCBAU 11357]MDA9499313.1 hypothetical protein [Bradyrhizobium sp. CCBAU 11357]
MRPNDPAPPSGSPDAELSHQQGAVQRMDALELQLRILERDQARAERDQLAALLAEVNAVLQEAWPADTKVRYLTERLEGAAPEKTPERSADGS